MGYTGSKGLAILTCLDIVSKDRQLKQSRNITPDKTKKSIIEHMFSQSHINSKTKANKATQII